VQYNVGLDQLGEYTVFPPLAQFITGVRALLLGLLL
jgi:hypothetical protein